MLSATSHNELDSLTKFLDISKLQNLLFLLYQRFPLQSVTHPKLKKKQIRCNWSTAKNLIRQKPSMQLQHMTSALDDVWVHSGRDDSHCSVCGFGVAAHFPHMFSRLGWGFPWMLI